MESMPTTRAISSMRSISRVKSERKEGISQPVGVFAKPKPERMESMRGGGMWVPRMAVTRSARSGTV